MGGNSTLKCRQCGEELDQFEFDMCERCKRKDRKKVYELKSETEIAKNNNKSENDDDGAVANTEKNYRTEVDPRLDLLYNRNVRCPYCRAKILKYTTTCQRCGVTKKQISQASNTRAKEMRKEKKGGKIFKTKHRPEDVSFSKMIMLCGLLGMFGVHSFFVGRKIRGLITVGCFILGIVMMFVFPIGKTGPEGLTEGMHPWREAIKPFFFPFDVFMLIPFILWAIDTIAVIFGFYKYPIRLGESEVKEKRGKGK